MRSASQELTRRGHPAPAARRGPGAALARTRPPGPQLAAPGPGLPQAAQEVFRQLDEKIQDGMARHGIPGAAVAVLYQGQEHVRGFGVTDLRHPVPVDGGTLFRIGSTSKTFTGTVAMRLAADGRLDLDTEVRRYLPGFGAPPGAEAVTVRQLLNHSAGWLGDDFTDTGRGWDALPRYVAGIRGLPQLTPAGTVFSYNNAAFAVAGRVVERLTGKTFEHTVRDLLLRPLGLRHSFYFSDEIIGRKVAVPHAVVNGTLVAAPRLWQMPRSINAASGLMSSAADQLRWARFHLGDGCAPGGARLLPQAALAAMRSHPGPGGTLVTELTGMGVSWMLRPTAQGTPVVQHGGHWPGEISGFLMVPGHGFAMTLLTNSESSSPLVNELFASDWALRLCTGLANLPTPGCHLGPAGLAPYLGRYTLQQVSASGRLIEQPPDTVTAAGGGLALTSSQGAVTLLSFYESRYGPDYLLVRDADGTPRGTRADFLRDTAGRVRWLRLGGRLYRHEP